jgi:hypothetical protein
MRIRPLAGTCCALASIVCAASLTFAGPWQEPQGAPAYHVVAGERHGVSFFPAVRHPEVEYEAGQGALAFDRFHTVDVMYEWLRRWERRHPEIFEVYEVAQSFGGLPILQVTITNKATGPATDKPAAFFEGGRHSGEITSSESVLWLIDHLLSNYGSDPEITHLIDTKALYLKPQNNPDGSNMYLHTAQANRSSVRPVDNDGDGLLDEDPGNDIDGDGVIRTMRWRPADGSGNMVLDERDPSGRLMRAARDGEEGIWSVSREGIDDDGDGRTDEDGVGGLDLHRNYVENWRPDSGRDRTGRGWTQFGAGAYPLSEPETRAVVLFLLENPNVSVANSMDTTVPMHLRPPSTSKSEERMYPEDLALYEYFDEMGLEITGYGRAGDVYYEYATGGGEMNPVTGEPRQPNPLFGHGPDFGYFYYGAIWYGDELWNGGRMGDLNGDGEEDQLDALWWDDNVNQGPGTLFQDWTPTTHPEHGEIEIGGFHPKFFSQNPPPFILEEWAAKQARFNLQLALHLPELRIDEVIVAPGEPPAAARGEGANDDHGDVFDVTVRYTNAGRLPTALRQAQLVKIVREDSLELELDDPSLLSGDSPVVEIIDPQFRDKTIQAGWIQPEETKEVTFKVRVAAGHQEPVGGTVHLLSTRGGQVTGRFELR